MHHAGARVANTLLSTAMCLSAFAHQADAAQQYDSEYYHDFPMFHHYPREDRSGQSVFRFGPVGIGIDLTLPAFGMKIRTVEPGSPAAATGKLKAGQIIESVNGRILEEIDPRIILGNIITKAEATDGVVRFMIKDHEEDQAREVIVNIPVLGAYSETWPLNCPKSDKIVRGVADYLARDGNLGNSIGHDQRLLFLLSTGEEQDLEVARAFIRDFVAREGGRERLDTIPWAIGYGYPALCEYYLQTGDASVLPIIQKTADQAARLMYNGGWNHRTIVNFRYGHMNAAGVHVVKFLLLAKECGVDVDEYTLQTSLRHFFRFAGRGNVPYGDGMPEAGFVDNGKVGGLAFAMAAAANLTPEGEDSIYAKARDISAVKGFYSTSWFLHGHTGGGIGEVWRSSAMGLMHDRKPFRYREFMDNRMWHYELSRRYDGSMAITADRPYSLRYDDEIWGVGYAMTYTIPRQTLRMTGAPPTQFSNSYRLPDRPWGNAADDAFYSLVPAPDANGRIQDMNAERLATDASGPIIRRVRDENVADEVLDMYVRHSDYNVRQVAANSIRDLRRDHLIMPLLRDKDPRVRHAGLMAIGDIRRRRYLPEARFTDEMKDRIAEMIADPEEAWWTVASAIMAFSQVEPERIANSVDILLDWMEHDEWWIQRAAMQALKPLAADPATAGRIIPVVGQMASQNTHWGAMGPFSDLVDAVADGPPDVREIGLREFARAYWDFPVPLRARGGANMNSALRYLQEPLARAVTRFDQGFDVLYKMSREMMPNRALPHRDLYFSANSDRFGPELAAAMPKIILDEVIPEAIGRDLDGLLAQVRWMTEPERRFRQPTLQFATSSIDDVVELYQEAGMDDYNWHTYGPERDEIKWEYFSYDLDRPMNPRTSVRRYYDAIRLNNVAVNQARRASDRARRQLEVAQQRGQGVGGAEEDLAGMKEAYRRSVAERDQAMLHGRLPEGLENWFSPDFNPQAAGWQQGQAPFAWNEGELKAANWNCSSRVCNCGATPNTLWENEVLLLRTTLAVPPLEPDYRYRLLIGGNIHPRQGGPITVYINGRPVHQQGGFAGRTRMNPRGFFVDAEMAEAFESGEVLIGIAAARLRNRNRFFLTAWLDRMKSPPLGDREILTAKLRRPMLSTEWQDLQDPDEAPEDSNEGKYHYSGVFENNPQIPGNWTLIAEVDTIEDFTGRADAESIEDAPFRSIALLPDGGTSQEYWVWSDNILMAVERGEALAMQRHRIGQREYLFIERGGFSDERPREWTSPWHVLVAE